MYQIFVVEDEILIRQSIRTMVEDMGGPYLFCGEAADGEIALSMMQDLMPDILLTDIRMPFLDGFGLIRHAKAMMPWLKIVIISGYDEFESAQKAISLGVDQYLLKPVRTSDLTGAIRGVAEQILHDRSRTELPAGYDKDELHHALYQHFMQQLFFGGMDTGQMLERARSLELDMLNRPFYQVVLFHLDSEDKAGEALRRQIDAVLKDRQTALYYFNGSSRLTALVSAKSRNELNENVYRIVNIIRHELKNHAAFPTTVTTVVGNTAERASAIKGAVAPAGLLLEKIRGVSAGQVIDINDAAQITAQITADIVNFNSSFGEQFGQRLLYASEDALPDILNEFFRNDADQFNSMLYRYYTLIDILKTAVQIVSFANPDIATKDIAARFSGTYDIFGASGQRQSFEKLALELLSEAVRMQRENIGFLKHGHVISQAEKYVAEHFCDPNISLISVARQVGLSSAHFSTVFSQTTGKTFISYLTALRIERAKELLARTDMKLAAIAMEIGYNEPNYFSHVFKKSEGITPKEYRNLFTDIPAR